MIKSYKISSPLNKIKEDKILAIFKEYKFVAKIINKLQWNNFYSTGKTCNSKRLDIKNIKGEISQRYKRNVVIQITGLIDSFISNRQNDFKQKVYKSQLSEGIKKDLYYINKYNLWFSQEDIIIKKYNKIISKEVIKLSRKILNNILKKHKKPSIIMNTINLNLDVVSISKDSEKKKSNKTTFDYWANLSTLEKGKKINIPLKSNKYIDKESVTIKHFIQITKQDKKLQFTIQKDIPSQKEKYLKNLKENVIGIDLGLKTLLTTSSNRFYGKKFSDKLLKIDIELLRLFKEKQKHNLRKKETKKYRKLVDRLRDFLKNEINHQLNHMIKKEKPSKLILEELNFQNPKLSKRLNRILSNFGKNLISKKLEHIQEFYGIKVEYINPAYTSQQCNSCDYISKENRKTQEKFTCIYCNLNNYIQENNLNINEFIEHFKIKYNSKNKEYYYKDKKIDINKIKINADYNASLNILGRSSSYKKTINQFDNKSIILDKIIEGFLTKIPQNHTSLVARLDNPYFNKFYLREKVYIS